MNHTKTIRIASRCTRLVPRALLVVLTVASVFTADHALARKAKGGLLPADRSATAAPAPVSPDANKPLPFPRRHGVKRRGASR